MRAPVHGGPLKDKKIILNIRRDLLRKRKEIEAINNPKQRKKALETYAELLTTLEISTLLTH